MPARAARWSWSAAAGRPAARPPTGRGCSRCARTSARPSPPRCAGSWGRAPPTSPSCCRSCATSSPICRRPPASDAEGARFRLFDSLAAFVKRVAVAQPLVLVLDDLHAADEPSLLLLQFVARELAQSRIVIVGACRDVDPTPADPLRATLDRAGARAGHADRAARRAGRGGRRALHRARGARGRRRRAGRGGLRRDRGQPAVRRRDRAAARPGGAARGGAAGDPAQRARDDRPPAAAPLRREQRPAHAGLGARARVRPPRPGARQRASSAAPSWSCSTRRPRRAWSPRSPARSAACASPTP